MRLHIGNSLSRAGTMLKTLGLSLSGRRDMDDMAARR